MAWTGGQYAITGTATNLLVALGSPALPVTNCLQIDVKNAAGAANICYLGASTVTAAPAFARVELSAGQAYTFLATERRLIDLRDVFIIGTANAANIAFISVLI